MATQITGPRGEHIVIIMLNRESIKQTPNDLLLYPEYHITPPLSKMLLLTVDNQKQLLKVKRIRNCGWLSLNGTLIAHTLFSRLRDHYGKARGNTERAKGSERMQRNNILGTQ